MAEYDPHGAGILATGLDELLGAYGLPAAGATVVRFGAGRIHASYRLQAGGRDYLLQRLNTRVFPDVAALAGNLLRVTSHLARSTRSGPAGLARRHSLELVPVGPGEPFFRAADGALWRIYVFIGASRSPSQPASSAEVYQAARCFGRFLRDMSTLPGPRLAETILGFHDTPRRLRDLRSAIAADDLGRAQGAADEIAMALDHAGLAAAIDELRGPPGIPERIVHNDCKLDNVLLDTRTGDALCVVDLDTVMPGCVLHDVGDLVRSAASGGEDGVQPDHFDLARFELALSGYLEGAGDVLTALERRHLGTGALVVTYELALRFLTDHLRGDGYFSVTAPDDNLRRAARQFSLLRSMQRQAREMDTIVQRVAG
jgi:hypothetical protein